MATTREELILDVARQMLLEGGYLTPPLEAQNIADPRYRGRLAEAVAHALGPVALN